MHYSGIIADLTRMDRTMPKTFEGQLEVDTDRGVVYFHASDSTDAVTLLRICGLDIPERFSSMDLTVYSNETQKGTTAEPFCDHVHIMQSYQMKYDFSG